jgi:hypothetical protein
MASSAAAGLLTEVLGATARIPLLKIDNKAVIDLIKNPVHYGRSKHIRIRYHFVRECAAEGRIEVKFVGTEDQLADIPKPLQHVKFLEMKEKIGVQEIKN